MTALAVAMFVAAFACLLVDFACLLVDVARRRSDRAARRDRLTDQLRSPSAGRDGRGQP